MLDEISQAFAEITPEDFFRETSAISTIVYPENKKHITAGVDNFHSFVDALVNRSKEICSEGEGFTPFSVLHNSEKQRLFHPDDDETAPNYAARLNREARDMDATWMFTAMLAPGRAYPLSEDRESFDPDDSDGIRDALIRGDLDICICWYAQMREGVMHERGGIVPLDDNNNPGDGVEGVIDSDTNPYYEVLNR